MKKQIISYLLGVLLILISSNFLLGQKEGLIKGKVIDAQSNLPLEYATITIYSTKDSSLISGEITNSKGDFKLNLPYGNYYGELNFLSYQPFPITPFSLNSKQKKINLGEIKLSINSESLKEIEVLSTKGEIQMTLDKRIFNVGKDLTSAGGNAADLLGNVPGVTVEEGKISLRGNEGVQILVDGKPSILAGGEDGKGLTRIPSNLIDKVEVITNPSAKYQARGTAGIINIILKKERKFGVNGSVEATIGHPDIYGASLNLNVRKNKFNLFTNVGYDYQKNHGDGKIYQELKNSPLEIMDLDREHVLGGGWGNIRLGVDYFINEKNTLTTSASYQTGEDNDEVDITYFDFLGNMNNPTGISTRNDDTRKTFENLEYAMTLEHQFGKKGHELVADIRFQDNFGEDASDLTGRFFDTNFIPLINVNDVLQRSGNTEGNKRWVTNLDYTFPISSTKRLELGYQGSFRKIINDFEVEEFDDMIWKSLPNLSNDFEYDENILGVYGTYRDKYKKMSYQIGGRIEHTDVVTRLLETNQENPRNYTNFFPSVRLSFKLKKNNSIKLSYSRRVRRPQFNELNPFFSYSDPRNQFAGNPDLNPEFADSYELEHIKYWDKASFSSAIFYRHRKNIIKRILVPLVGDTTLLQSQNLKVQDDLGVDFTFIYNPFKWWKIDANTLFFYVNADASNIDNAFQNQDFTWQGKLSSQFTILKKTMVRIRFNYRAPQARAQGESREMAFVNIGASRKIGKKGGKLSFNISDLFSSMVSGGITDTPTIFRETEFRWRYRTMRLTYNYRF